MTAAQFHAQGVQALHERRLPAAIAALQQAVARDERSSLYVTDLGYAYLLDERLGDAESAFRHGIELDPKRPHAYAHLVECILRDAHRWEKRSVLLQVLEQGLHANPEREFRIKLEIARIRAERGFGLLERAREHIEDAMRERPLPRPLERQLLELRSRVNDDERARALRDWPEPDVSADMHKRLSECEQTAHAVRKNQSIECVSELLLLWPAWRAPRELRTRLLIDQGHYDEAVKELTTLTRLQPSNPMHFRQLGLLLAEHGGLLELERADEALRIAFALEPEWSELVTARERLAARRFDASPRKSTATPPRAEPSENARRLYEEAEATLGESKTLADAATRVQDLLDQALRESPTFIEAAALSFTVTRRVPEKTVASLWNDAAGLFGLYQECMRAEPALPRAPLERWLNRAIELGSVEGRFSRALNQKNRGDRVGAERELANYLALVSNREEVQAVQLLRAELLEKPKSPASLSREAILAAQLRLQSDDTDGALKLLEAPCRAALAPERLLWLGIAYERRAEVHRALECYDFGLAVASDSHVAIARRLARLLARAEPQARQMPIAQRLPELVSIEPAAEWALARRSFESGHLDEAQQHVERYLASAPASDRFVGEAAALQKRLKTTAQLQANAKHERLRWVTWSGVGALILLLTLAYRLWLRGVTVARAIRKRPGLFPELQRTIGRIRHDVFKHRTCALQVLGQDASALPKVRSTMLEPVPTSAVVAEAYERLCTVARAEGVQLRPLNREPVFGALIRDLRLVEASLEALDHAARVQAIDVRLRTLHSERLQSLLAHGPQCELDASTIQTWISAVRQEPAVSGQPHPLPALQMSELSFAFPVERTALFRIFSNLLRNAAAATEGATAPKLLVRLQREQDFSGRAWVKLQIGDNAEAAFTELDVESRPADRGLGIVRETVREWNGRVVVLPEPAPYRKSVGVEFAL
jgi:tetratricopeptide (TPR) repeat protein